MTAAVIAAILPTSSGAAVLSSDNDFVVYSGEEGETNDLTVGVTEDRRALTFTDAGAPIEARKACSGGGETGATATCPLDRNPTVIYASVIAFLAGGDDEFDSTGLPSDRPSEEVAGARVDVLGGKGADSIETGPADDSITAGAGDDLIFAGDGFDFIDSARKPDGADEIDAGPGYDEVDYDDRLHGVELSVDGVANDGVHNEGDNLIAVEGLQGSVHDDRLVGDAADNSIYGMAGDDEIVGGAGNDSLYGAGFAGRDGDDVITGGLGDDELLGEYGRDVLKAGPGNDEVEGAFAMTGRDHAADRIACGQGRTGVRLSEKTACVVARRCASFEAERARFSFARPAALRLLNTRDGSSGGRYDTASSRVDDYTDTCNNVIRNGAIARCAARRRCNPGPCPAD